MLDHNWHDQLYKRLLTTAMVTKFHYCCCGSQLFIKRFSSDGFLLIQALVAVVAAFPWHPIIKAVTSCSTHKIDQQETDC